ncbi:MAG: hypothetical protein AAB590_00590 [Patescibacteria group bacterium]
MALDTQQLITTYQNLPKNLHDFIYAPNTDDKFYQIAADQGLEEKWRLMFIDLVHLFLIGIKPISDLVNTLKVNLEVSQEIAEKLATNVTQIIPAEAMNEIRTVKPELPKQETPKPVTPEVTGMPRLVAQVFAKK